MAKDTTPASLSGWPGLLFAGPEVIRSERYYGQVRRGMTLDSDIDQDAAAAKYVDGVLTLTLPKKAWTSSKRLTIK